MTPSETCRVGIGSIQVVLSVVARPRMWARHCGVDIGARCDRKPGPGGLVGLVVAAGLLVGSIPLVPGLVIVMPMLGQATWHRYRRIVPR